jgi:hypothetical protein
MIKGISYCFNIPILLNKIKKDRHEYNNNNKIDLL